MNGLLGLMFHRKEKSMHVRRFAWIHAVIATFIVVVPSIPAAEYDKYLPDDTEFVLHANIRLALDSALGKKYLLPQIEQNLKGQAEAQQLLSAFGLDPLRDLTGFTIAAPGKVSEKNWTALLHGSFDLGKIQAAAEAFSGKQADTLKIQKQDGATIYEIHDAKHSHSAFATFVEKNTLLISSTKDQVTAALSKKAATKASTLDKDLVALLNEGSGKESLSLVLVPHQLLDALPKNNTQAMAIAKKIRSFKGGTTLTDGVQLSLRVQATDDQAARDVRQTLEGLKAILVLAVTSNDQLKDFGPTLTDILNSIKFTLDKSTVGMDLTVSGKQIEDGLNK